LIIGDDRFQLLAEPGKGIAFLVECTGAPAVDLKYPFVCPDGLFETGELCKRDTLVEPGPDVTGGALNGMVKDRDRLVVPAQRNKRHPLAHQGLRVLRVKAGYLVKRRNRLFGSAKVRMADPRLEPCIDKARVLRDRFFKCGDRILPPPEMPKRDPFFIKGGRILWREGERGVVRCSGFGIP